MIFEYNPSVLSSHYLVVLKNIEIRSRQYDKATARKTISQNKRLRF